MSIIRKEYINEFFGIKKKEKKKESSPPPRRNHTLECTKIEVSASDKSTFDRLYNHEALCAEGLRIADESDLEAVNNWFRTSSKCNARNVNIYIIKGKTMNIFYHLTDDNAYPDDLTIVCIDWVDCGVSSPHKGVWRWFSDVVDNNAKREIANGNHYYDHYHSIYYGDIGIKD